MASNSAAEIIDAVGGPGNVASLTHCATRLRFQLHDGTKASKDAAEKIPGVQSFTYRHCASLDDSPPPYHLLAEVHFADAAALAAGLSSPEGQAAAGDVPNFATGGVTMFVAHD